MASGGSGGGTGAPTLQQFTYPEELIKRASKLTIRPEINMCDEWLVNALRQGRTDDEVRNRIKYYRRSMSNMAGADQTLKFLAHQLDIERFYTDWREIVDQQRR